MITNIIDPMSIIYIYVPRFFWGQCPCMLNNSHKNRSNLGELHGQCLSNAGVKLWSSARRTGV